MAKINWNFKAQPDSNWEYVVAATTGLGVSWQEFRKVWAFQVYTRRILNQLNNAVGCTGFSLHARFNPITGSTISVWETTTSLRQFYKTNAHGEAMDVLGSGMPGKFQYVQWKSLGAALPKTWEEVMSRFKPV